MKLNHLKREYEAKGTALKMALFVTFGAEVVLNSTRHLVVF
jgi:hypothetical protein